MALMNRRLSRGLEVVYLMPSQQYTYLNSTLVKEVARLGGVVRGLVPLPVEEALRAKLGETSRGVTVSPESARRGATHDGQPRGAAAPRARAGAKLGRRAAARR
jgi:hypothetical protein